VIAGQYVGIEVKAPKGKQSENQQESQRQLEAAGGKYILAYSIDDVERALDRQRARAVVLGVEAESSIHPKGRGRANRIAKKHIIASHFANSRAN